MLIFSARARTLWGHAPRVRSAAVFRRGLATVADHIDARYETHTLQLTTTTQPLTFHADLL
jgi:hypothetical protein